MSRAFVKESDGEQPGDVPELPQSPHCQLRALARAGATPARLPTRTATGGHGCRDADARLERDNLAGRSLAAGADRQRHSVTPP